MCGGANATMIVRTAAPWQCRPYKSEAVEGAIMNKVARLNAAFRDNISWQGQDDVRVTNYRMRTARRSLK